MALIERLGDGKLAVKHAIIIATDYEGGGIAVGTTPVIVTFTDATIGISIQSAGTNTGTIFLGGSTITSDGHNSVRELSSGEAVAIDYDDSSNALYVVASAAGQLVRKFGLV